MMYKWFEELAQSYLRKRYRNARNRQNRYFEISFAEHCVVSLFTGVKKLLPTVALAKLLPLNGLRNSFFLYRYKVLFPRDVFLLQYAMVCRYLLQSPNLLV